MTVAMSREPMGKVRADNGIPMTAAAAITGAAMKQASSRARSAVCRTPFGINLA
jgi:hypothetical protein